MKEDELPVLRPQNSKQPLAVNCIPYNPINGIVITADIILCNVSAGQASSLKVYSWFYLS